MPDEFTVEFKGDHVHATVRGEESYAKSLALWKRIVAVCAEHDCYNILGETHATSPLSTMDAFDHVEIFRTARVTMRHRIAWVGQSEQVYEAIDSAATALKNRGLANGHVFRTVDQARVWLLEGDKDASATKQAAG